MVNSIDRRPVRLYATGEFPAILQFQYYPNNITLSNGHMIYDVVLSYMIF